MLAAGLERTLKNTLTSTTSAEILNSTLMNNSRTRLTESKQITNKEQTQQQQDKDYNTSCGPHSRQDLLNTLLGNTYGL